MEPTLTWLDLTARDRDKMRRMLDLMSEQGTVDEMGLGSLRDAISDELFPGTSSIQTRLRYALFVPWCYQRLERRRVHADDVEREARKAEIELITVLADSDDSEGVIGRRAGAKLTRLPSQVYWAGLVRWGIFAQPRSQSWYHAHFSALDGDRDPEADDPGVIWDRRATWHRQLPLPPAAFPREASFALTRAEAEFLGGRFEERCPSSLLAWMSAYGSTAPAEAFWDDPDARRAGGEVARTIELARRFSLHVEGAPLLYNLLVAERLAARPGGDAARVDEVRARLAAWGDQEGAEAPFQPDELWLFLARRGATPPPPQRTFVDGWSARVAALRGHGVADDGDLRARVELRERQLKGPRARLANENRLLEWRGAVGLGRMDFRWFRVRQMLVDLHRGLEA